MTRTKKWLVICAAMLAILIIAFILVSKWSNGPATGTIQTEQTSIKPPEQTTKITLPIDTPMFKTVLPAGFTASDASLPSGDVRVRVLAIQRAERQQAAFIGGILPQEGLAGLADYNLRIKDTTKYLLSSRSTLPNGSVAFEAIDGTMLTVFLVHGNDYAEITITGDPASTNELYNTMSIIQQEWTWK